MHQYINWPTEKGKLYPLLAQQLSALIAGCPPISALANMSSLLWEALPDINWAGFYLNKKNTLHLGPFQGKTACVEIPFGRGVCGTAAITGKLQLVPDVELFPGHIACDSASRSEIVLPMVANGQLCGVLDIDAPIASRFDQDDADGLSALVHILVTEVDWSNGLL